MIFLKCYLKSLKISIMVLGDHAKASSSAFFYSKSSFLSLNLIFFLWFNGGKSADHLFERFPSPLPSLLQKLSFAHHKTKHFSYLFLWSKTAVSLFSSFNAETIIGYTYTCVPLDISTTTHLTQSMEFDVEKWKVGWSSSFSLTNLLV